MQTGFSTNSFFCPLPPTVPHHHVVNWILSIEYVETDLGGKIRPKHTVVESKKASCSFLSGIKTQLLPLKEPLLRDRLQDTERPSPRPKSGKPHPSTPWSSLGRRLWAGSPPFRGTHPMSQRSHSRVQHWTEFRPWSSQQCKSKMNLMLTSQQQHSVSQESRKTPHRPSDRHIHQGLPNLHKIIHCKVKVLPWIIISGKRNRYHHDIRCNDVLLQIGCNALHFKWHSSV